MLKLVQQVKTATGTTGKLEFEVVRNGETVAVSVREKQGGLPLVNNGVSVPKFHFVDLQEMKDLQMGLAESIAFLEGK